MKYNLLWAALLFSSVLPAQEIYSWVDKNGVTKFSDQMPQNISADKVKKLNINQNTSYKTVKQLAKDQGKSVSQQQRDLEALSQKTCLSANKNLQILTAFDTVTQLDKDGKEQVLTVKEKDHQISLVKKQIEIFCEK